MVLLRYQFLEEAFQNHKGLIETNMAKLHEKNSYVHHSLSQVQHRWDSALLHSSFMTNGWILLGDWRFCFFEG